MGEHAHAALDGSLQALLLVEVQHRRAERPHEDLGLLLAVLLHHLHGTAGDDVRDGLVTHGNAHGVRVGEATVDEHARVALAVVTPVAKDIIVQGKRTEDARSEDRQRLADGNGVAIDGGAVGVFLAPRIRPAVVRVGVALHARLVAVVDAGDAGERHLHKGGNPQAAHAEAVVVLIQPKAGLLLLAQRAAMRRVAQHVHQADAVMATQQVERRAEGLAGIVLAELLGGVGKVLGRNLVSEVVKNGVAERVVHDAVQLVAMEVLTQLAIGNLGGGVLPDLADEQRVGLLGQFSGLDLGDEVIGQLVGNVQTPTARTSAQPLAHHAILAADQLAVVGIVLIQVRKRVDAPPALVGAVVAELEPVAIRRIGALVCADGVIVAQAVEIHRVCAGVVEHAIKNDGDATVARFLAETREALLVAQHRINLHVVAGVVAMVGLRLEDGVQIEDRDAQALQVVKMLANALKRAAVELPLGDAAVLSLLVAGGLVPVVNQLALGAIRMQLQSCRGALLPVLATGEAVREDLVDDAVLVPVGKHRALELVAGDLERRRLAIRKGTLARRALGVGAIAPHVAVCRRNLKAIPNNLRHFGRKGSRETNRVTQRGALHLDELLAVLISPQAQLCGCLRLVPHVNPQSDGHAHACGTKRIAVLEGRSHMLSSHIASFRLLSARNTLLADALSAYRSFYDSSLGRPARSIQGCNHTAGTEIAHPALVVPTTGPESRTLWSGEAHEKGAVPKDGPSVLISKPCDRHNP